MPELNTNKTIDTIFSYVSKTIIFSFFIGFFLCLIFYFFFEEKYLIDWIDWHLGETGKWVFLSLLLSGLLGSTKIFDRTENADEVKKAEAIFYPLFITLFCLCCFLMIFSNGFFAIPFFGLMFGADRVFSALEEENKVIIKISVVIRKLAPLISFVSRPIFIASIFLLISIIKLNSIKNIGSYESQINSYELLLLKSEKILSALVNFPVTISLLVFSILILLSIYFPKYTVASKFIRVKRSFTQLLIGVTFVNLFAFTAWKDKDYFRSYFDNYYREKIEITSSNIVEWSCYL